MRHFLVAPLVGAWIEIFQLDMDSSNKTVAPLVGAWIEILAEHEGNTDISVAPLVGAWIEICRNEHSTRQKESLPLWERGLKYTPDPDNN